MAAPQTIPSPGDRATSTALRERLFAGIPAHERRIQAGGAATAVLEGGDGPPIVLLHGPGEFAGMWASVIPDLVATHRIVAPDLPGHGRSEMLDDPVDAGRVLAWLDELVEQTCPEPPTLVGHVLGGAIAARYAIEHGERLSRLVLVDSLGLGRFRPAPMFALTMAGFQLHPTQRSYDRFMRQCSADLDGLKADMGERWEPFAAYNVESARNPKVKAAVRTLMRTVGIPRIPDEQLARIAVPTTLIWGRQDRANRLGIAEEAGARHGWPLHVVDDCADDPPRDRPEAFLRALRTSLAET